MQHRRQADDTRTDRHNRKYCNTGHRPRNPQSYTWLRSPFTTTTAVPPRQFWKINSPQNSTSHRVFRKLNSPPNIQHLKINSTQNTQHFTWTRGRTHTASSHSTLTGLSVTLACPLVRWSRDHGDARTRDTPICGSASLLAPNFGFMKNMKYGLISCNYNSQCFEGTSTIHSGTFNCAFQSTPHRLLPESFLMECPGYCPSLEPISSSQGKGAFNL